jgi:hypothetical protein
MAVVLAVSGSILAADQGAVEVKAPKAEKPHGGPRGFMGKLAEKPADAAAGVVAALTVTRQDKETVFSVIASDEALVKKIADLQSKGVKVVVKGELTADGKGINAVSAEEIVARPPAVKKPKVDTPPAAEIAPKVDTPPPAAQ